MIFECFERNMFLFLTRKSIIMELWEKTHRPDFTTLTDGTKEVIAHEDDGLVIPYSQPQALADAILRFYEDHALCEQCGNHAHALVAQRFNAQRVYDAVGQIYREVINKK